MYYPTGGSVAVILPHKGHRLLQPVAFLQRFLLPKEKNTHKTSKLFGKHLAKNLHETVSVHNETLAAIMINSLTWREKKCFAQFSTRRNEVFINAHYY